MWRRGREARFARWEAKRWRRRCSVEFAFREVEQPTSPRPSPPTPLRCVGGEGESFADVGESGSAAFREVEQPTSPRPSPPTALRCVGGEGESFADVGEFGSAASNLVLRQANYRSVPRLACHKSTAPTAWKMKLGSQTIRQGPRSGWYCQAWARTIKL